MQPYSAGRTATVKEYLEWVDPKHHGLIIGKNGTSINEIRHKSGAIVKIEKNIDGEKCYVQGTRSQIDLAKTMIESKISQKEKQKKQHTLPTSDPNWSCIRFVSNEMIGKVVGKNGSTIRTFEDTYKVRLKTQEGKLYIFGDLLKPENKSAIEGLHELLKGKLEHKNLLKDSNWHVIEFVKPEMIGKVIGKGGETIKSFEKLYEVKFKSNEGKLFIYGNIQENKNRSAIEGLKELLKDKLDNERMLDDSNWSEVEFIPSECIGKVIGKNGETINSFEEIYEVKLRVDGRKLYIYGALSLDNNRMALEGLRELVQSGSKATKLNRNYEDNGWEIVEHIDSSLIGFFIGKQGTRANKMERKYGVQIKPLKKGKESYIAIKGDNEGAKERLRFHLRSLNISYLMKDIINNRKIFSIGNYPITLIESKEEGLCKICTKNDTEGNLSVEKSYSSIPGLRDNLLHIYSNVKEEIERMNGGACDYMIHAGRIFCRKPIGDYSINEIPPHDFVYHRLQKGDLDISKIEGLPKIKEFFRYDIAILTPKPFIEIRYKLFVEEINGSLLFISPREAGVNEHEIMIDTKPGYIQLPYTRSGRLDIIDPTNSNTLRISTNMYNDQNHDYESKLTTHLDVLIPIFKEIKLHVSTTDPAQIQIKIPDLPDGYLITYLRQSIRKTYRFSGSNVLRTSEEKVFKNLQVDHEESNDITDLFFVNENINDLLEDDDWDPEEVVNEIESVLKFSDTMLQFLS